MAFGSLGVDGVIVVTSVVGYMRLVPGPRPRPAERVPTLSCVRASAWRRRDETIYVGSQPDWFEKSPRGDNSGFG